MKPEKTLRNSVLSAKEAFQEYLYGHCFYRFPVLAALTLGEQPFIKKSSLAYLALKHDAIMNGPLEVNEILDPEGAAAQVKFAAHAFLRKAIPEWLKKLSLDGQWEKPEESIELYFQNINLSLNHDAASVRFSSKGELIEFLAYLQSMRFSERNDVQMWDFFSAAIESDEHIITGDSWSLQRIAEKMNDDHAMPWPDPSECWTARSVGNVRDRFIRFVESQKRLHDRLKGPTGKVQYYV